MNSPDENAQLGRKGKPAHRRLIELACRRLVEQELAEGWLHLNFAREQPLDIKVETTIKGDKFGDYNVAKAEQRNYCDIACAVRYDPRVGPISVEPAYPEFVDRADRLLAEGKLVEYKEMIRRAYGMTLYIIECETNPKSNLLRNGPRLSAYQLIKQQNRNLTLILAVYEGTKVDNPKVFDMVWEFPRKGDEVEEEEEDAVTGEEGKFPGP